ncbi:vitamin K-dependent gamma-carboxylase-like protein [Tenacibaculum gallaicum]|uniref:Vitamin K-dependent gamma-carboxylase-like protein n=1 Tax=Tenacibaculum gallaicum TaxID=561505 RepID=A0A3E0HW27_9FLAO|nr:HTTM domain-containing protein [Tenacibaculum gallaicum]REH50470.1 vitamin K-dependent gamma-carboxylase-like protein [Tenacibaculum gallaicum]
MINTVQKYFKKNTEAATLVVFRIFFGFMMFCSILRFWLNGWIEEQYIKPKFFFSYYGFEYIKPLGNYTYLLFFICAIAALLIMLGYKYRAAAITFFLSFTYIELMDKSYYLNHYYFVSLVAFILIFLPANAYFSVDAKQNEKIAYQKIPNWTIDAIKLLLGIVYFYAGLAKLNSDWLFRASPLSIWLPVQNNLPLVGFLMSKTWFHFAMSWAGAIYDLTVPFLLLNKRTRTIAFVTVVVFHVFTRILFSIGMFPYIMIVSTIIFFNPKVHHKILNIIAAIFRISKDYFDQGKTLVTTQKLTLTRKFLILFFILQIIIPFRYLLYPGELFWTEEGYRFSWRVMLTEKAGYAEFKIIDEETKKQVYIDNSDYLTTLQEKQMSFQSDFILEFAHFLGDTYKKKGMKNPKVYVDSYVTLNGRLSTQFINPKVDLYQQKESFKHKNWIIPFNHEIKIKGL